MKRKNSTYIQPLCEVYQLLNEVDLLTQSPNRNKPKPKPPTLRIDESKEITDENDIFYASHFICKKDFKRRVLDFKTPFSCTKST